MTKTAPSAADVTEVRCPALVLDGALGSQSGDDADLAGRRLEERPAELPGRH